MYPSYTFIYHSIPSYDGICEYMSGYQGVRIPDGHMSGISMSESYDIRVSVHMIPVILCLAYDTNFKFKYFPTKLMFQAKFYPIEWQ